MTNHGSRHHGDGSAAMDVEFDTVATWTADAVSALGPEYAIPAACRGSGSPAALKWLGHELNFDKGSDLLDVGAGVGGPAAFAAEEFGIRPILADPMLGACHAARRLFALPVVAGIGQQLPFATGSFAAAWSLGVLCTTTDKLDTLAEIHRVVRSGSRLGLLVFVQTTSEVPTKPEGNEFPSADSIEPLLHRAGFAIANEADLDDFPAAGADWQRRADRVIQVIDQRHKHDSRWITAQQQQSSIGWLLENKYLRGRLIAAEAL